MAWKDTLLNAAFRGVPFHCERIGRAGQRAIAAHDFPYAAGAELDDMNLGPRMVRVQAIFFGDDYEDRLFQFISALEAPGAAELVHPIHGSMTVMAQGWEDEHDAELVDGAVLQVNFIEDRLRTLIFRDQSAAARIDAITVKAGSVRLVANNALAGTLGALTGRLAALGALPSLRGLGSITGLLGITGVTGLLASARSACAQVGAFVRGGLLSVSGISGMVLSGLDPLLHPRAYAADLLTMLERGFQGFSFGGRNRTYVASSSASASIGAATAATAATASAASANVAITPAPASPLTSGGVPMMTDFGVVHTHLLPQRLVLTTADQTVASPAILACQAVVLGHAQAHLAAAIAESVAIVLAGETETPVLNRTDIEQLVGQVRTDIQVTIDTVRGSLDAEHGGQLVDALATLAIAVQEAARAVINQRPPLVQRPSPVSGPLRLVAHAMYGDPGRATDLMSLNRLGRAILIDKGQPPYAYSR